MLTKSAIGVYDGISTLIANKSTCDYLYLSGFALAGTILEVV